MIEVEVGNDCTHGATKQRRRQNRTPFPKEQVQSKVSYPSQTCPTPETPHNVHRLLTYVLPLYSVTVLLIQR